MPIEIERVEENDNVRLRCDHAGGSCVEIPLAEVPKAIRALFLWLAFEDEKAARSLLRGMKKA